MTNYILRRNNWGEESCANLQTAYPDLKIVNKDVEQHPQDAKWCIRWGTTSDIPQSNIVKVINKAQNIHKVYNKAAFRKLLADEGLAPKTVVNEVPKDDHSVYPAVLRPLKHFGSNDLYLSENEKETGRYITELKKDLGKDYEGFYLSRFVDKDREFRVFVVSGRVVATLEKIPSDKIKKEDVSWGVGEASWKYVNWNHWPIECVKTACAAFRLSDLDFGAVDMIMEGSKAYCLEINTAPLVSPYYAGQFVKGIRWIIEKDDRKFIKPGTEKNYKSYIHPALEGVVN